MFPPIAKWAETSCSNKQQKMQLSSQLGLTSNHAWLHDAHFWSIAGLGLLGLVLLRFGLPELLNSRYSEYGFVLVVSIVLWQPLVEELLFRGVVQGLLLQTRHGAKHYLGITLANVICSLIFVVVHTVHQPLLWALAVFLPSLLFGYMRDRHGNIYPALALHILFNAGFLAASL